MLGSIQNLREITRLGHAGEPLDQDLSSWLGNSLQDFLDHRCRSIDDALGLRFPKVAFPGGGRKRSGHATPPCASW